jgi:hypothetical protein
MIILFEIYSSMYNKTNIDVLTLVLFTHRLLR